MKSEKKLEKAKLVIKGEKINDTLICEIDPSDYTIGSSNYYNWVNTIGVDQPTLQYNGSMTPQLNIELYFDTLFNEKKKENKEDVRKYTDKIVKAMSLDAGSHKPPEVQLIWGSLDFVGVISSATFQYIKFQDSGKPVRAKVQIAIMGTATMEDQLKRKPLESPDRTKHRKLNQKEALWMLANQEYKDPRMWKVIAKANRIANPRVIPSGKVIKIPSL